MSFLILEHAGRRSVVPVTDRILIGRDEECDLVVNHPIVSRRHAYVEISPQGAAVLIDNGSRNGILIAGERLTEPRPLADGDTFQIGPATFAYHEGAPNETLEAPSVDEPDPGGIVFACQECGVRLWAPVSAGGASSLCPQCGAKVRCPAEPSNQAHPEGVCPVCHFKIEPEESSTSCPSCGLVYHVECWERAGGCVAEGCRQNDRG